MGSEREKFVLASKYTLSTNLEDPNASGNHRKNMVQAVNASLKRLKTDYLDILWVHAWDKCTPIEEMMRGLDDLVRQGRVLYIGISDAPAWVVARANTYAELMSWQAFQGLQLEYSLILRDIEREYFEMAHTLDLAITAWSPLGGGVLTGKYLKSVPGDVRYKGDDFFSKRSVNDRNQQIAQEVVNVAKELGKTPAQVALNWLRQKNSRVIPIVGARSVTQLKDSLGCLDFALSEQAMKRLDEASRISSGFPHDFLASDTIGEMVYGKKRALIQNHR